ncbi:MAG: outer membrane protein assembly factor BamB [Chlamydiales bacterium]|jgi:outer membrane protein assembly factor BamB
MRHQALLAFFLLAVPAAALGSDWPRWRGPLGTGEAVDADPPVHWSETENIAWKVALPGHGKSTPIVHGDRLFLVAAVPTEQATEEQLAERSPFSDQMTPAPDRLVAFLVLAFDRRTGKPLWETMVTEKLPVAGVHSTNGYGSFSPVTDGDGVYVSLGSYGVYALDAESGEVRWSYEIGPQHTRRGWGEAGSPALTGETLVVVADQEGTSRIHVLDAKSGEVRWVQERDEPTTWTTPLIVEAAGKTQIVVNGTTAVRSYDAQTGDVLWHCDGQTVNAIPTPVTDGALVVCASGYRGDLCVALPLDRLGDLRADPEAIAWSRSRGAPYVPSLLLADGRVYMMSGNDGMISCLELASGEVLVDRKRLDLGNVYASPIAANGRVYVVDRDGTTVVLDQSNGLEVLATNVLDGQIDASPVALGQALYLRSDTHLYAIGKP